MDAGTRDALPDQKPAWLRQEGQPSEADTQAQDEDRRKAADAETARIRAERFLTFLAEPEMRAQYGGELFDLTALAGIRNIRSNGPGHCQCEFPVQKRNSNLQGTLHGGCTATLVDTVGSAALATVADKGGVSTHIGSEYFLGLPVGDVAVIDATVMHQGNKLCNIEVKLRSKATGALVAAGSHWKYIAAAEKAMNLGPLPQSTNRSRL